VFLTLSYIMSFDNIRNEKEILTGEQSNSTNMTTTPHFHLNYSERSHVLVGDFQETYKSFREEVLSASKSYTYNPRLKVGCGWLINKESYSVLCEKLTERDVLYTEAETTPELRAKQKKSVAIKISDPQPKTYRLMTTLRVTPQEVESDTPSEIDEPLVGVSGKKTHPSYKNMILTTLNELTDFVVKFISRAVIREYITSHYEIPPSGVKHLNKVLKKCVLEGILVQQEDSFRIA